MSACRSAKLIVFCMSSMDFCSSAWYLSFSRFSCSICSCFWRLAISAREIAAARHPLTSFRSKSSSSSSSSTLSSPSGPCRAARLSRKRWLTMISFLPVALSTLSWKARAGNSSKLFTRVSSTFKLLSVLELATLFAIELMWLVWQKINQYKSCQIRVQIGRLLWQDLP